MEEKKRTLNPEVKNGDRIKLLYMAGETSVSPLTKGTVIKVCDDPLVSNAKLITVNWDDGSKLNLLSNIDKWVLDEKKRISEENDTKLDFYAENSEIFKLFDWKFLKKYLKVIQKTGIVNMLESSPLLYCGSEHLDRYYGEDKEDDENFKEALEMSDEAKQKMIQGTINWMEKNNKEITVENANKYIRKLSVTLLTIYANFY